MEWLDSRARARSSAHRRLGLGFQVVRKTQSLAGTLHRVGAKALGSGFETAWQQCFTGHWLTLKQSDLASG